MIHVSDNLVASLLNIIQVSGKIVLNYFGKSKETLKLKSDDSPITEADIKANEYICGKLSEEFPNIPIISEEGSNLSNIKNNDLFFLVDPLDGTKEFINKTDEFTVNIALIKDKTPIIGVINVPSKEYLYWTNGKKSFSKYKGNEKKTLKTKKFDQENLNAEASKSHFDSKTIKFMKTLNVKKIRRSGSSLKLCNIASGKSNIYPRFGNTMEWDIAAGHAILSKSGGQVFDEKGKILKYSKEGFRNKSFVALSQGQIPHSILEIIKRL